MNNLLGCVVGIAFALASFLVSAIVVGVWLDLMLLWAGR
jgi:uncharacterized membrane protein YfhO